MIELAPYKILAWDYDDTLIHHPKSAKFWEFIRANPYDQTHVIVTMRSHGMEQEIFPELNRYGSSLTADHFDGVHALPDHIYESYARMLRGDVREENHAYFFWKGEMCKKVGAQVLIDDMENASISSKGCRVNDILHFHPDDL